MNDQVSVIITTWNRKKTVLQSLDAFSKQSFKDFEVIVCDDGSTDGTHEMMEDLVISNEYPFELKYCQTFITNQNGISRSRNLGLMKAIGEFVLLIDVDCIPHKDMIKSFLEQTKSCVHVQIGHLVSHSHLLNSELPLKLKENEKGRRYLAWEKSEIRTGHLTTGCCFLPKEIAMTRAKDGSQGFDERFIGKRAEDKEWAERLSLKNIIQLSFNPDAVAWHMNPSETEQIELEEKKRQDQEGRELYVSLMKDLI